MRTWAAVAVAVGLVAYLVAPAPADILDMGGMRNADGSWTGLASLETVPMGDPGNHGQLSGAGAGGYGPDRICGSVGYAYNIGKYEVTAGQYCEFLNHVAGVDTYGLYNPVMWSSYYGCKIERFTGNGTEASPGRYRVAANWANRPVNYVSFWDACRFANWLHNGQPTGGQDNSTTENGAYTLTPQGISGNTVIRNASWRYAVTSEDEWYKAAYYDPHRNGGAGYWLYPTGSDEVPGQDTTETTQPGNNANYSHVYSPGDSYWRTVVGEFELSDGPYGTFDQGGNVMEWNDMIMSGSSRGMRGGKWSNFALDMRASVRYDCPLNEERYDSGFRVVQVPEPATLSLLALGGLLLARRRRV